MIAAAELAIQRRLTAAFINADYILAVLYRSTYTADGAGGEIKGEPEPLAPQRMRLIPLGDGATPRTTANGESVTPSYMLMGTYTADIQRWDEVTVNGRRYQVVFINENQQYEVKAEVAYLDGV
jgi:hypothetical protein